MSTHKALVPWGWVRAILFFVALTLFMEVVKLTKGTILPSSFEFAEVATLFYQLFKLAGTMGLIWIFRRLLERADFMGLGFQFDARHRRDFAAGTAMAIAMVAVIFALLWASGNVVIEEVQFPLRSLALVLLIGIVSAIREEIATRGYILNNLMTSMNRAVALVSASAVFALFHLDNPNATALSALNILLAGIWLGVYYVHRRNLWFPIGLHFGWNLALGPIFGSSVSGYNLPGILVTDATGSDLMTGGRFGFEGSILATIMFIVMTIVVHVRYGDSATN